MPIQFIAVRNETPTKGLPGNDCSVHMYRVRRNKPQLIGVLSYATRGMAGHSQMANRWLIENKHIPKSWVCKRHFAKDRNKFVVHHL